MKWWKHQTDLWDMEGVAALVTRKGPAGYGVLIRVFDVAARAMERGSSKCSVRYSVTRWSDLLSLRGSHVRHWLSEIRLTGVVTVEWIGTDIEVTIPILLKWRDEYSSKSGHSPDSLPSKKQMKRQKSDAEGGSRPVPPQAAELAELLRARILENNPSAKITEHQLASWADEARLMIERDHRDPSQIGLVIDWAQANGFWRKNVLSMGKLREKFDRFTLEMRDGNGESNGRTNGKSYRQQQEERAVRQDAEWVRQAGKSREGASPLGSLLASKTD